MATCSLCVDLEEERHVDAAILGGQASLNLLPPSLRVVGKMFVCRSTILRNPFLDEATETATKTTNQTSLSQSQLHCRQLHCRHGIPTTMLLTDPEPAKHLALATDRRRDPMTTLTNLLHPATYPSLRGRERRLRSLSITVHRFA